MKKILIGTHNQGKFHEIAYLVSKKYVKISPIPLKIKSPRETGNVSKLNRVTDKYYLAGSNKSLDEKKNQNGDTETKN